MAYAYMSADLVFIPTAVVLPLRSISKAKIVNQILFDFYYQYSKFSVLGLWFYDCRGIREIVMTYSLLMMSHITCCVQPVTLLKCNIEIFLYSNIWSLNSVLVYCTTVQLYSVRTRNDDNYLQSECELPIYITPQVR